MDKNKASIPIGLAFNETPPAAVDAGAKFSVSLTLNWPEKLPRENAAYAVRNGDSTISSGTIATGNTLELTVTAPEQVGEHRWTIVITAQEKDQRGEGALAFTFKTIPHATSLAVWDTPSPIVRNTKFTIKAGAKCTSSCAVAGRALEVRDETGKVMGSAPLSDSTWAETTSLYWTTIGLKAPRKLGLHSWSVNFAADDLKPAHEGGSSRFSFVTVAEPAHSVSVKVVDKKTKAPLANAQVRLGPHRAVTDESGAAKLGVPKGEFPLVVTHARYEMSERTVEVTKDLRLRIAAEALPEEDPFAIYTA